MSGNLTIKFPCEDFLIVSYEFSGKSSACAKKINYLKAELKRVLFPNTQFNRIAWGLFGELTKRGINCV